MISEAEKLKRIVYWSNQGRALSALLSDTGYEAHYRQQVAEGPKARPYREWYASKDGDTLGIIHESADESFLFLWTPEARRSWWRALIWRLRHPLTKRHPRRPLREAHA